MIRPGLFLSCPWRAFWADLRQKAGNRIVYCALPAMNPLLEFHQQQTRRQFFGNVGLRAGNIALASMLGRDLLVAPIIVGVPAAAAPAVSPP